MTKTEYTTLKNLAAHEQKRLAFALYVTWTMGRNRITTQKASDADRDIKDTFPMNMWTAKPTDKDDCRAARLVAKFNPLEVVAVLNEACFPFPNPMARPVGDEDGVCPVCGEEYEIEDDGYESGYYQEWTCPHCGAIGAARYDTIFDRHYDVRDANIKPIPGRPE